MATLFGMFPFLKTLFADGGYQGPKFATALAKVLPHLDVQIVKRSDTAIGFKIVPKRWIVERTIAWLNRCRRLAKDWENLNRKALAFLRLASIRLMLRKLCNPAETLRTDSKVLSGFLAPKRARNRGVFVRGLKPDSCDEPLFRSLQAVFLRTCGLVCPDL
jgi:transposase